MEYSKLNKKALNCMYVATSIGILITIVMVIGIYFLVASLAYAKIIATLVLIILALILIISPQIRYKRYGYLINNEQIDIIEGLIYITRSIVPIKRIHKITVQKGPIDKIYGLSKVIVTTAGGDVTIRFLEDEIAEEIANNLKTKINDIVSKASVS